MKIFINDIPVYILSEKKINMDRVYGLVVREFENIVPEQLVDDTLIMNASFDQVDHLLKSFINISTFFCTDHKTSI